MDCLAILPRTVFSESQGTQDGSPPTGFRIFETATSVRSCSARPLPFLGNHLLGVADWSIADHGRVWRHQLGPMTLPHFQAGEGRRLSI
jgi:hypothetical protein